jgi:hypothetical protein
VLCASVSSQMLFRNVFSSYFDERSREARVTYVLELKPADTECWSNHNGLILDGLLIKLSGCSSAVALVRISDLGQTVSEHFAMLFD